MKKAFYALATASLAAVVVALGVAPSSGQGEPASEVRNARRLNLAVAAPERETRTGTFYNVCSADFALRTGERRNAIQTQLRSNPAAINRLSSVAGPGGTPSPLLREKGAGPLKLSDIHAFKAGENESVADHQLSLDRQHERIALIWGQKWPNGTTLHVRFLNTDPSWNPIKERIKQFAREWEQFANVTFAFDDSPSAQIRIYLASDNFAWSSIGTDALSKPADEETMHYGWFNQQTPDEEYSRTVIHEFGHALGAIHEHQHPDAGISWNKQAVYDYYASATPPWTKQDVDVNMFQKYDRSILQFGAYDPTSIMHYPIPPTFTTNGFSVGWNTALSAEDKSVLAWVYPKPH